MFSIQNISPTHPYCLPHKIELASIATNGLKLRIKATATQFVGSRAGTKDPNVSVGDTATYINSS